MGAGDGIAVWTVDLSAVPESLWQCLIDLLDASEAAQARRFAFEQHRRQYTAAHGLKRLMLSAASADQVNCRDWRFEIGAYGKPRVAQRPDLKFNLSHCAGRVACALARGVELGLDVETLDRHAPMEVAGCYFAPAELAWLRALPEPERPAGFFQLWTLKEAYIKATGLGLSQPLQDFAFALDPPRVAFADPALGDPMAWRFEQRALGPSHLLAVAWKAGGDELPVTVERVCLELLLAGAATGASQTALDAG